MIIDSIDHILMYEPLVKGLSEGVAAVFNMESIQEGRHEFEGGYFLVQTGETQSMEEGTFEAHRKYVDIQILLEGCEELAWSDISNLNVSIPYNAEKDVERLDGVKNHHMLISKGMFYIVFPHDGHKAVSHSMQKNRYKKIVLKIPVTK